MPFNKLFFENFNNYLATYNKKFDIIAVTVSVNIVGHDYDYNIHGFLAYDDSLLTFTYYDEKKSVGYPAKEGEKMALPQMSVPYENIMAVEIIPANVVRKNIGFVPNQSPVTKK